MLIYAGFPAPKIIWRREDGQSITVDKKKKVMVYDGDVLQLSKITRNEMGAYLCIATNGVPPSVSKRIILDVECKRLFLILFQSVTKCYYSSLPDDLGTQSIGRRSGWH